MISQQHHQTAQKLKSIKEEIQRLWEESVRNKIIPTSDLTSPILQNSLGTFLDHLGHALVMKDPQLATLDIKNLFIKHGFDRAHMKGYFLAEMLKEFSILREVIVGLLRDDQNLTHEDRNFIDKAIDAAISVAASEFVKTQTFQLEHALVSAKTSNAELNHFASVAAHDLKSPLATIIGFINLLEEEEYQKKLGDEGAEMLDLIKSAAQRMGVLIDAILEYARIEKPDRNFEAIPAESLVKAALDNLRDRVKKSKAQIIFNALPTINCDPPLIAQLFQNLIANSIKFHGSSSPKIVISASPVDDEWKFQIRDNGIGFDPSHGKEIFQLYKKLHSNDYQGTGIGLATCKRIVELHGGKIWAESQPGEGSTFYFTIPKMETHH